MSNDACPVPDRSKTAADADLDDVRVERDDGRSRFVLLAGGTQIGAADYQAEGDVVHFTHTVVDHAFQNRGLGAVLARAALDAVVADGKRIAPHCSFIRAYVRRHPDRYGDAVVA